VISVQRVIARRKGFVLAAALLALLIVAGMVAAAIFAANEGTRMVAASSERQRTLAAAESSIEDALTSGAVDWASATGETTASSRESYGMPVAIYRTRLDTTLFWVVADAGPARPGSGVMARVGVLVRVTSVAGGATSVDRIRERWWSELF
jgi:Tfp pilus assembly protein PilX